MDNVKKKYGVVTGATSGIGKSYAEKLASQQYNLIITGRRKKLLEKNKNYLEEKYNIQVDLFVFDLTDKFNLNHFLKSLDSYEQINYFVNNAGFGNEKDFFHESIENIEKMLQVHINTSIQILHKISKIMIKQKNGFIVSVNSLAAFLPGPMGEIYSSTKLFLNQFVFSTSVTLKKNNVYIQALCPGFTYTNFHEKMGIEKNRQKSKGIIRWMSAERVVDISYRKKKSRLVIPGFSNKIIYYLKKILPDSLYFYFASKSSNSDMDEFFK